MQLLIKFLRPFVFDRAFKILPLLYYPLLYYLPSILYAIFIFTLLSIEYMVDFDRVFIAFDHIAFLVIYCIIYSILRF